MWAGKTALAGEDGSGEVDIFGHGRAALQHSLDDAGEHFADGLFVDQAHLDFGGMDVDIDILWRHIEVENEQWVFASWQQGVVTTLKRLLQCANLHPAAIDKDGGILAIALGQYAVANRAVEMVALAIAFINGIKQFFERQAIEFGQGGCQITAAAG